MYYMANVPKYLVIILAVFVAADAQSSSSNNLLTDGKLIDLDEDNWNLMLKGEWMIEFYAPWCPACKNLAPTWERYAKAVKDLNVNVAKIDVTTSPSLSGRFFVTALPTIYHVKDGDFRQYRGSRDSDALQFFIIKRQWQKIEPISAWKKPDTIHMSILSYFFKLSHTLKDFNGRLQEEYGLPTWGSYALFAIATIFLGAALGLVLVCIVDFIYPPKKSQRQSFSDTQDNGNAEGIEDLATDDIEDDAEGEQDDEQDDEDEEDEAEEESTSEGEKNSHSESEAEAEAEATESEHIGDVKNKAKTTNNDKPQKDDKQKVIQETDDDAATNNKQTTEVRKRKPRKAD